VWKYLKMEVWGAGGRKVYRYVNMEVWGAGERNLWEYWRRGNSKHKKTAPLEAERFFSLFIEP
jgi:hypothetical protein